MAASRLASTSSTVMPYGIALPCQTRHKYCLECIKQYITTELDRGREGNVVFPIRCPECSWGEWEIPDDTAVKVLEAEHYERWHFQKLFEKTNKYYCPNPHCSTLLDPTDEGETRTKKAQCPLCRKRLCIPCRSLDHEGMSCSKNMRTQRRKGIEGAAVKLARQRGWRRCPKCEVIVERISGCDHMTCKCRHSFCYRCGSDWTYKCSRQWRCKLRLTEGDQIAAECKFTPSLL
ncbi:hypothetical protein FRC03_001811 [Tulasnella sp. 419]|nr:hypothetical protein FRC03_001811 [Tulasnella sp. 419]